MNSFSAVRTVEHLDETDLLQSIRDIISRVGDGLNDDELTCLLRESALPIESGFVFLSYSERFLLLKVPKQDWARWHPDAGWIAAEKEALGQKIAAKYEFSLCEPPDALHSFSGVSRCHHHLELVQRGETMVVAHSQYLKIRLFSAEATARNQLVRKPVIFGPDLLRDLAALYQ